MKFTKQTFLMLGLASMFSVCVVDVAMGGRTDCTQTVSSGKYCKNAGNKPDCPQGCYCTGGIKFALGSDFDADKYCRRENNYDWHYDDAHIYRCPDSHPKSNSGSSSQSECYYVPSDRTDLKVYVNERKSLDIGYYLKKNTWTAVKCEGSKDITEKQFCPGGSFVASLSNNVGFYECPGDGKVNSNKTTCTITCESGKYLPKNGYKCEKCAMGNICTGVQYTMDSKPGAHGDLGLTPCENGLVPNNDATICVQPEITVDAGYYLPGGSASQKICTGTKQFCPGGMFAKSQTDQGRYDCPFGGTSSEDHTACRLKLTEMQMRNGISGNGKCWMQLDPEDFKLCVFGLKTKSVSRSDTTSGQQRPNPRGDESETSKNIPEEKNTEPSVQYYKKNSDGIFIPVEGKPTDICNGGYWSYSDQHGYLQVKCMPKR